MQKELQYCSLWTLRKLNYVQAYVRRKIFTLENRTDGYVSIDLAVSSFLLFFNFSPFNIIYSFHVIKENC